MNVADSEIVASILNNEGHSLVKDIKIAEIILINTCSVRENAEIRVQGRLNVFRQIKKENHDLIVGLIGCMAQRIKEELLDEGSVIDIIAGPDSYRNLPNLISEVINGKKAIDVNLSEFETYSEILPFRYQTNNISAFIPIMRGCNNHCAYCVVPGTRGTERSSSPEMVLLEAGNLIKSGYKEIVLIGQNVDSYNWTNKDNSIVNFSSLLEMVAKIDSKVRIRFATSHPKDLHDNLLETMAKYHNICKCIHLPVQSGSTRLLKLMNRGYTREWYMDRIKSIRRILPDCAISTDIIAGFCSETVDDHNDTLSLMEFARFDFAFMFKYNERPGTQAQKEYKDDVPGEVKTKRLTEIINMQSKLSMSTKKEDIGKIYEVLIEGHSKKSQDHLSGRNSQNKMVVFPGNGHQVGEYVNVLIKSCTSATLIGEVVN